MESSEKESTTAPVWADAPRSRRTTGEWAALRACCCRLPGMANLCAAGVAGGLALAGLGVLLAMACLLEGPQQYDLRPLAAVVAVMAGGDLVAYSADGAFWFRRTLHWLADRPPAKVRPDGIHFYGRNPVPLRRLKVVCRYEDRMVLAWGDRRAPRALILTDLNCEGGLESLWRRLQMAAPEACFLRRGRLPSFWLQWVLPSIVMMLVLLCPALLAVNHYQLELSPTLSLHRITGVMSEEMLRDLAAIGIVEIVPEPGESAAPTPQPTPLPTHALLDDVKFDATVDARLTNDGLYFTWDGGQTVSRPAGAELVPAPLDENTVVITEEVGAFLTSLDGDRGSWVVAHTTTDQGATWNDCELVDFVDVLPVEQMYLGFLGADFGYAAVSTGSTPATGIGVGIYTTRDGGKSWQPCAAPLANNASHPVTSLLFIDEQTGLATLGTSSSDPWPIVCLTQDGGQSWQQLTMPWDDPALTGQERDFLWADEGLVWLGGATALTRDGDGWTLTLTQAPDATREAVFAADDPAGEWVLQEVRRTP